MNNKELNKFNIGFEFEFMIKKSMISKKLPEALRKAISPELLDEYRSYFKLKEPQLKDYYDYFLSEMKEHFPQRNWQALCKPAMDGSIYEDNDNYSGIEIVVEYQPGVEAVGILREICTVLSSPQFKTNQTCGLHANVSYINETIEDSTDLSYYLSQRVDQEKIAQRFNRKNNEYCTPNLKTALDRDEFNEVMYETILTLTNKKLKRWGDIELADWQEIEQNLQKEKSFDNFITLARKSILKTLQNEWIQNRPAIAPKSMKKVNYIEFRSMGGLNYQKKLPAIEQSLEEMLLGMQSYSQDKKAQQKKKTVKM